MGKQAGAPSLPALKVRERQLARFPHCAGAAAAALHLKPSTPSADCDLFGLVFGISGLPRHVQIFLASPSHLYLRGNIWNSSVDHKDYGSNSTSVSQCLNCPLHQPVGLFAPARMGCFTRGQAVSPARTGCLTANTRHIPFPAPADGHVPEEDALGQAMRKQRDAKGNPPALPSLPQRWGRTPWFLAGA